MTPDRRDVPFLTILGGGPAGLAAGLYGRREGISVQLFEAESTVGGNTRTLELGPFRYDTGAHRFHDKDPDVTADVKELLGDDLHRVDAPSQICWRGRRIDFPLAPFDLFKKLPIRLLAKIAREQCTIPRTAGADSRHFEEMAERSYGPTLARLFLLNYTEKLWGRPCDQLSPKVAGDRLDGLDLKTFFLEAVRSARQKARHLDGSFYYPRNGYGMIAEATADAMGRTHIETDARITAIEHDSDRVGAVVINDRMRHGVDRVLSTLPLPLVLRLLDPPPPREIREIAESIQFRFLRLVVLGLDCPRLTRNASLYFPARDIPFTRLYEPKNRSPHMAPADQTVAVLERPCEPHEPVWERPASALREAAHRLLVKQNLIDPDTTEIVAFESHDVPYAYPILEVGTQAKAERLKRYLDRFENLWRLGRSADFTYTHVHNLFAEARSMTAQMAETAASRSEAVR